MQKQIYTLLVLLVLLVLAASSYGQDKTAESSEISNEARSKESQQANRFGGPPPTPAQHNSILQISRFVRRIFEDNKGNFWFGTNGDGVCRYDGKSLDYFSRGEGLSGSAVRGIVEDKDGILWFGTNGGVSKFNGESFVNFTVNDGLGGNDVWSIYCDRAGNIWVGTLGGASRFDAASGKFAPFPIPESEPDYLRGVTSAKIVHSIMEDSKGRMWFGTTGGAYIYDGDSLSNISEKDGLCNNSVNDILEDKQGNIWFATHHKGVSRYDGKSFTNFTMDSVISGNEVWSLHEDKSGNIWFPAEGYGVYRHDGKTFTSFHEEEGLASSAIQCIFEDDKGRVWFGGWLGLFRYDGKSVFQVTTKGPWG